MLARLLNSGQLGDRPPAALPALAAVAACYAAAGLVNAGVTTAEARLAPGGRRLAEDDLVTATARVELESFDDPEFHDALVRARDRGVQSLDRAVLQLVQLAAAGVSLLAIEDVARTVCGGTRIGYELEQAGVALLLAGEGADCRV
jgi:ATP-binding cassette subfamily B protein